MTIRNPTCEEVSCCGLLLSAIIGQIDLTGMSVILRLNDGRSVAIRPIHPADVDALRTFYAGLLPRTRALRFHLPIKELPEDLLREFTAIDDAGHVAFVAEPWGTWVEVDQPATLVAEARYVRQKEADSAEFAVVVADDWHRAGLGTLLVRALLNNARLAGVRSLCGDVLVDNRATHGFMGSLGARPVPGAENAQTVRLCLEPQAA
jgi:acetyltransferase